MQYPFMLKELSNIWEKKYFFSLVDFLTCKMKLVKSSSSISLAIFLLTLFI